jgi:D-alanyl-lipoteichoic acid acyltransferase DltB (MBOAT superfamily)
LHSLKVKKGLAGAAIALLVCGSAATLLDTDRFFAGANEFTSNQLGPLTAISAAFAAGFLMRLWWRFRSRSAIAFIGLLALTAVYGEQVASVYVIGMVVLCFVGLADWATRNHRSARWHLANFGIVAVTGIFLIRPHLAIAEFNSINSAVSILAIIDMLLLLKLVLFLWEFGIGRVDRPGMIEFLAWYGLPFTTHGLILRYSEFRQQPPSTGSPLSPLGPGWWLGVAGGFTMFAAAGVLSGVQNSLQAAPWYGRLLIYYGTSPWACLFWAAALTGLLRQAGTLGGVSIPRNFDQPFRSRDLSEFWSRWNITITRSFRDMLFFNRWGLKRHNLYLNTMIVFIVVGLWHAQNTYWLLWGTLHGLGFCAYLLWRTWRGAQARPLPAPLGWALTYGFVCSCWVLPPQILKLSERLLAA